MRIIPTPRNSNSLEIRGARFEIHCFVIHLGLFAVSRRRQVQKLVQQIKSGLPTDAPLIIAGDFNDWTNALSDTLRKKLDVEEVFDQNLSSRSFGSYLRRLSGRGPRMTPARTFPAAMPVLKLDRIYVRGFDVLSAKVLHGTSWARLSDHAPLVAELSLLPSFMQASIQPVNSVADISHASSQL